MNALPDTKPTAPSYLEQYKAYIGDLGNIGTRYATANGFYLSVVTALLGILAFAKDAGPFVGSQSQLAIAVPAFAMLVCWIWWRTVGYYRNLFAAKFKVLREIEEEGSLFHTYGREAKALTEGVPPRSLLTNERLVPVLVGVFFLLVLISGVYRQCR